MRTFSQEEAARIRHGKRMMKKLLREAPPSGLKYQVHLEPVMVALGNPRFGEGTLELLAVSFASATSGGTRECFCCCRPWTPARSMVAVFIADPMHTTDTALIAGVCEECYSSDRIVELTIKGAKRDLGGNVTLIHKDHPPPQREPA